MVLLTMLQRRLENRRGKQLGRCAVKTKTRNLILIFCGLLILIIFILYGYSATVREKNAVLKAENARLQRTIVQTKMEAETVQTENNRLQALIAELERTDEYYYRMAMIKRENARKLAGKASLDHYEKSNEYLENMMEQFPDSSLKVKAKDMIRQNNDVIAANIIAEAEKRSKSGAYLESNLLADKLITQFPKSYLVKIAKELKRGNASKAEAARREKERKAIAKQKTVERSKYDLELLSWGWSKEHGYVTGEGQVKNISGKSLRNVQALATFYDSQGGFITTASAMIGYNPILAGQTSPFTVMETQNPAMKKASIEFKYLMGGTIPMYHAK